jgi:hypothetical protein
MSRYCFRLSSQSRTGYIFTREAIEDLKAFKARQKKTLLDTIEAHLRHEPEKVSREPD